MLKLKMQIIPLQKCSKRPMFNWVDTKLTYKEAMYFALKEYNLAVVCNNWYLLDLDRPDISAYHSLLEELKEEVNDNRHSLTANTSNGFHFWLDFKPKNLDDITARYKLDVPRHDIMYALVPYSTT